VNEVNVGKEEAFFKCSTNVNVKKEEDFVRKNKS